MYNILIIYETPLIISRIVNLILLWDLEDYAI